MFAEHIKRFMDISEDNYQKIVENNYKLVDNVFSRKEVAARYIELANNPNLDLNSLQSRKVKETIDEIWCNHFGFTDRIISKSTLDSFF
jgi:hypothetical protein